MAAPEKLPYERTAEENRAIVNAEVKKFFKKREPEKKKPLTEETKKFLLTLSKPAVVKRQSDYERIKGKKSLRQASIDQVREEQQLERFLKDANMTKEQFFNESVAPKAVERWQFKLGELLVAPDEWAKLTYQLRKFHAWYMNESKEGRESFEARVKEQDLLHGDGSIFIFFEEMYRLYQYDALDVSILSCWTL